MGADSGRSLSLPALVARSRLPDGPLPALSVRCGAPGIGRWCRASKSQGVWSGMEEPVGGGDVGSASAGKTTGEKGMGGGTARAPHSMYGALAMAQRALADFRRI